MISDAVLFLHRSYDTARVEAEILVCILVKCICLPLLDPDPHVKIIVLQHNLDIAVAFFYCPYTF